MIRTLPRLAYNLRLTPAIDTSLTLPSPLSTLLAVPIPNEHALAGLKVQAAVEQAVRESIEQGIDKRGKEVTPWLLKRVGELSSGRALISSELLCLSWIATLLIPQDIALIENNAAVGARVAVEVARLRKQGSGGAPVSW